MGAHAALVLGDVVGDRAVDVDGDRDVDCSVPRVQTATCPWPSPWAAQLWRAAVAAHPIPLWALQGNHDGHQAVPLVAGGVNYSEPNGWWLQTVRPLEQPGVVGGTVDAYEVRVELAGGAWSLLVVSDVGWRQDRAQGGRVDWRDLPWRAEAYARASTMGWPGQVVTEEQIAWLEDRLVAAEVAGRHVAVATHAPPAGTVVLTDAPGRAYAQVCPPSSTFPGGIYVHGTSLTQYPRDADLLPARSDLEGTGNPREVEHEWVSAAIRWQPGQAPDPMWALELVRRHHVDLWVAGHNHLPVPDLVVEGRGVRWDDPASGTVFLSHGSLTSAWCSTAGACRSQAARLELRGDGSWSWERWSMQSSTLGLPAGCATAAKLPDARPAPWGLPVETGP
jgi:hypothetical protein